MTDFDLDSASRQLRVIRSLMERATIYRSLSAPTAFAGGLLSFVGLGLACAAERGLGRALSWGEFQVIWLVILVLTGAFNGFFLWREAQRRGQPFFSAGMKCAMFSVLPPFLCAGFFSLTLPMPPFEAAVWILFYGLGLLSMQTFAPRSIIVLGWAFLLSIAVGWAVMPHMPEGWQMGDDPTLLASWMMAMTFGLFHIVYAVAVWAMGGEPAESPAATTTESGNV